MRRFMQFALSLAVLAGVATSAGAARAAQPEPQPVTLACATDMSIQILGNAMPESAPDQALVLVRAFFAPGGGIGPHTHPGTLVVAVESGQFGVTLEEEGDMGMAVMRAGGTGTPPAEQMLTPGEEVILNPGDWFVETGMAHSARNAGAEEVAVVFTGLVEAGQPVTSCVG